MIELIKTTKKEVLEILGKSPATGCNLTELQYKISRKKGYCTRQIVTNLAKIVTNLIRNREIEIQLMPDEREEGRIKSDVPYSETVFILS